MIPQKTSTQVLGKGKMGHYALGGRRGDDAVKGEGRAMKLSLKKGRKGKRNRSTLRK